MLYVKLPANLQLGNYGQAKGRGEEIEEEEERCSIGRFSEMHMKDALANDSITTAQ